MKTNEATVVANSADNPTGTPPILVSEVLEAVLRCLLAWLEQENNGQKNHLILTALAKESLKKVNAPEASRKFDKKEIFAACGQAAEDKELSSWLKWPDLEKYWDARKSSFLSFATSRGIDHYPVFERKSTPGRIESLYWISTSPIVKPAENVETAYTDTMLGTGEDRNDAQRLELEYQCTQPGEIACALLLKPWLSNGKILMKGWGAWSVALPLGLIGMVMLGIIWLALALVGIGPANEKAMAFFLLLSFAYFLWLFFIRPMAHLADDRIICADGVESFKEKPGQLELARVDGGVTIRLVRYSSCCPVCGASVSVEKGEPDFPRRLVGRCAESPREHVFSFDRVTRKGKALW
jgi:hypothetical protein